MAQYLADELESPVKHEYLGGVVYAMSGARNRHNRIVLNVSTALATRLRGQRCEAYNSDTKVRIQLPTHVRFYYPDVQVVCDANPESDSFQDRPVLVVEVLSASTRRIDEGEKRDAYLSLPSLGAYLMIEQESPAAVIYRRGEAGFVREVHEGLEVSIALPEGLSLPLAEVYERVEFGRDE